MTLKLCKHLLIGSFLVWYALRGFQSAQNQESNLQESELLKLGINPSIITSYKY